MLSPTKEKGFFCPIYCHDVFLNVVIPFDQLTLKPESRRLALLSFIPLTRGLTFDLLHVYPLSPLF